MARLINRISYAIGMAAIIALIAGGCSSGGNGGGGSSSGPVKTTSKGVITGFGSVFVNGVEYDSVGAAVTADDNSATESDLQIGMVVTVSGSVNPGGTTGTADSIAFADRLEGPVSAIYSAAGGTLVVMGQVVKVDGNTIFQNIGDATLLVVNDMVEVSGFPDANGVILATRIEKKSMLFTAGSTTVELKGLVSGLTGSLFLINALSVDAGGVTIPAGLTNGSFVEVRGTLAAAAGPMTATFLELEPLFSAGQGEHVEVEGIVTDYVSQSDFKVNGVPVDGSALGIAIANGMMIEVEGTMSNGVLVAGKGELEMENNILLEGDATAVTANSLAVLGKTVAVTATTQYKDSSVAALRDFRLADIAAGDHVIVVAYQGAGSIVASCIERKNASTQARMKGVVSAATATTSLTILDVAVDTSTASFRDINSNPLLAADFFAAITPGTTVVKVKWSVFTTTSAPVNEADIESAP